jgi:hypothetical protein
MKLLKHIVAVSAIALGVTTPVFAHHSQSQFDLDKTVTVTGVVTEADWANPHTFYYMDVKGPDGKTVSWAFEANAPNALNSVGWQETSVKEGDHVSFTGNPRKDGKPTMLVQSVTLKDGKTLSTKAR